MLCRLARNQVITLEMKTHQTKCCSSLSVYGADNWAYNPWLRCTASAAAVIFRAFLPPVVQAAIRSGACCSARTAPVCAAVAACVAILLFGAWYRAHYLDHLLWRDVAAAPAQAPLIRD